VLLSMRDIAEPNQLLKERKTMKRLIIVFWIVIPVLAPAQNHPGQKTKEEIEKMHQDSKAYISMLENPQRDAEQKPDEVIRVLGLKQDESIADIGAGSGYFAFRFARHVGDGGHVYAVDIDKDMILFMNRKIQELKLRNVSTVLSMPDNPLLIDGTINRFFICNTWHHVQSRANYLSLMKKALKPGGQIIVLDYQKKELPVGPPPEMKMAREDVLKEMEEGGFKLVQEHTFLPYQYFLIFAAK
jgi:ubiquinone/menaquinone biosynthesis C-methylase UbiE